MVCEAGAACPALGGHELSEDSSVRTAWACPEQTVVKDLGRAVIALMGATAEGFKREPGTECSWWGNWDYKPKEIPGKSCSLWTV